MKSHREERQHGLTLLELTVAIAVSAVLMSAVGGVFTTLSSGATDVTRTLETQKQVHRARMLFLEDLQAADTLNSDVFGESYFQVLSVDGGTRNSIAFRKVESYEVSSAEDRVTAVYGPSIRYWLDSDGVLMRQEDGRDIPMARGFSALRFSLSDEGVVTIVLTPQAESRTPVRDHELRITPRNNLSI